MKIILLLMISMQLYANFTITYKNMQLGTIKSFETLEKGYIVAHTDSIPAKIYAGFRQHVVFHKDDAPDINSAKFEHDDNGIIDILILSKEQPKKFHTKLRENRYLTIECEDSLCKWYYSDAKKVRTHGIVKFRNDNFLFFKDLTRDISIKKES